jgi:2-polyprenyl-6-methoxyphenol hydroxylase-like FAD-dependent oxidoreductase
VAVTTSGRSEIVIVGGGLAGSAAAAVLAGQGRDVLLLERDTEFTDQAKGEWLAPWGVAEAQRVGVIDFLLAAGGWEIRTLVNWDGVIDPADALTQDMTEFTPGVGGPLGFALHQVCTMLATQAGFAGAQVVMGARKTTVVPGPEPVVRYEADGRAHEVRARLVLGAGGITRPVGRQVGVGVTTSVHHWGGALAVEGLTDWPADVQAYGTDGDVMFIVAPQGYGRVRLYLNFAFETRRRFQGPDGVRQFLDAFDLRCLPYGKQIAASTPAGPMRIGPAIAGVLDGSPVAEGVVLIGDEAGFNDVILGTGLANALRDVRIVTELLAENRDWGPATFQPYCDERRTRMARLHHGARIICQLNAEFGPAAVARRRRAIALMTQNRMLRVFALLSIVAPEDVPEFGFSEFIIDRLLPTSTGPGGAS